MSTLRQLAMGTQNQAFGLQTRKYSATMENQFRHEQQGNWFFNAIDCDLTDSNWEWVITSDGESDGTSLQPNVIKMSHEDICPDNPNSNVCHLYVEHLNLSNTEIYIENVGRPVVIHPYLASGNRRLDLSNYHSLKGSAKLCGVDSITAIEKPSCTSENKSPTLGCSSEEQSQNDIKFEG